MDCMSEEEYLNLKVGDVVEVRDFDEMVADGTFEVRGKSILNNTRGSHLYDKNGLYFNPKMKKRKIVIEYIEKKGSTLFIDTPTFVMAGSYVYSRYFLKSNESNNSTIAIDENLFNSLLM